jgi:UDPglucose 6-dehydrogenase
MNVNINAEFQNEFLERMKQKQVTIAVLGLGYVGLPTALGFAELGWRVLGADVSPARVETVQNGEVPFYEPGIGALLGKHLGNRFTCTSDIESAIQESGILFLCVGTPQRNNGEADLQAVEALARTIARNMNSYKLIIEKSTVPAITGHWINRTIQRYRSSNHTAATAAGMFDVASNPEFLQEGKATEGFFHPERIVCGVESPFAKLIVEELFSPFTCPLDHWAHHS